VKRPKVDADTPVFAPVVIAASSSPSPPSSPQPAPTNSGRIEITIGEAVVQVIGPVETAMLIAVLRAVRQWQTLSMSRGHPPTRIELVDGYPRNVWCYGTGREVIEEYNIVEMGHGTPREVGGHRRLQRKRRVYAGCRHLIDKAHSAFLGPDIGAKLTDAQTAAGILCIS
jgi:poly(3-hydroxybutyrate) depolymerase